MGGLRNVLRSKEKLTGQPREKQICLVCGNVNLKIIIVLSQIILLSFLLLDYGTNTISLNGKIKESFQVIASNHFLFYRD